jgi:hypothetical protein
MSEPLLLTFGKILSGEIRSGAAKRIGKIGDIEVMIKADASGRWRVVIAATATLSQPRARRLAELIKTAACTAGQCQRYEKDLREKTPPKEHPDYESYWGKR